MPQSRHAALLGAVLLLALWAGATAGCNAERGDEFIVTRSAARSPSGATAAGTIVTPSSSAAVSARAPVSTAERSAAAATSAARPARVGPTASPASAGPNASPASAGALQTPACYVTGQDRCNCGHFPTRAAARHFHDTLDPNDTNKLDADHDGEVCESLP